MQKQSFNALVKAVKSGKFERVRQKKWDDMHMITATCRIRKEAYRQFKEICEYHETTIHRALRSYIAFLIIKWNGRENVEPGMRYSEGLYLTMTENLPL